MNGAVTGAGLVGREPDLAVLADQIVRRQAVTLTGPPGVGKTRLAAEALRGHRGQVHWVGLRAARDPAGLLANLSAVLGVATGRGSTEDRVLARLGPDDVLVLDDVEGVAASAAPLVALLARNDRCVVCTSAVPLGIDGEQVVSLARLAVPARDAGAAEVLASPAATLFLARAAAVDPGWHPDAAELAEVGELCRRLDGLPLALELAAGQLVALTVATLVERLGDRMTLLVPTGTGVVSRSLSAAIDGAFAMLTPSETALLQAMSCVTGSIPLALVERLGAVRDLVALSARALVVREAGDSVDGGPRFRLLDSVRLRALDLPVPDGGADVAGILLAWAVELAGSVPDGPGEQAWVDRLTRERHLLQAAVERSLPDPGPAGVAAAELVALSARWWLVTGRLDEAARWLGEARRRAPDATAVLLAQAQVAFALGQSIAGMPAAVSALPHGRLLAAELAAREGRHAEAETALLALLADASEGAAEGRDAELEVAALCALASAVQRQGRYVELADHATRAGTLALKLGNPRWRARAAQVQHYAARLTGHGDVARLRADEMLEQATLARSSTLTAIAHGLRGGLLAEQEDVSAAVVELELALASARIGGDAMVLAVTAFNLGELSARLGDAPGARRAFGAALHQAESIGDARLVAWAWGSLADVAADEGDDAGAARLYVEAIRRARELLDLRLLVEKVEHAAVMAAGAELPTSAAVLGAVRAIRRDRELVTEPLFQRRVDAVLARAAADPTAAAAVARGERFTLERAVAEILAVLAPALQPPVLLPAVPAPARLVLRLLGGFTVEVDGIAVQARAWQSRKARDLLKILALAHPQPVNREEAREALWPDGDPAAVANRMSVALSTLRSVLGPARGTIRAVGPTLALDHGEVWLDVGHFHALAAAGDPAAAEAAYPADLLPEDAFEEWSVVARERTRATFISVARALAEQAAASGQHDEAARVWRRIIERDPYDEVAHQGLVCALADSGGLGEARRAQHAFEARMAELGLPARPPARALKTS